MTATITNMATIAITNNIIAIISKIINNTIATTVNIIAIIATITTAVTTFIIIIHYKIS